MSTLSGEAYGRLLARGCGREAAACSPRYLELCVDVLIIKEKEGRVGVVSWVVLLW
jgi:hypothetical protein